VVVIVWWLDLQLLMQSVPVTTNVGSLNHAHGGMHSIDYVIKFVSDRSVISPGTPVSSTSKSDSHVITEILLWR
jgi:hypothetical protein